MKRYYNNARPHQSLSDQTPAARFRPSGQDVRGLNPRPERNGVVSVGYQQVSVGKHYAGSACDVLVTDGVLQFWVGNELLKTVARTGKGGEVRKKHADGTARRH